MEAAKQDLLPQDQRQRIMDFVMAAGVTLLQSGAEVARVQESMTYMARGLHLREFDAYVLTNGLMASAGTAELAEVRHVEGTSIHLGRIEAVNALSRDIASGKVTTVEQAELRLVQAQRLPESPVWAQVLCAAGGSAFFCLLFGGTFAESLVSLIMGFLLGLMLHGAELLRMHGQLGRCFGSALVTAGATLAAALFPAIRADISIIGCLMVLTPGVAITMGIRDFCHADYLSGLIRIIDALVSAGSIAVGVGGVYLAQRLLF